MILAVIAGVPVVVSITASFLLRYSGIGTEMRQPPTEAM